MFRFRRLGPVIGAVVSAVVFALAPVSASAVMVGGDVSNWQGRIDMAAYVSHGADFMIHKATEGVGFVDPYADVNIQNAIDAGLRVGAYHFARPESNSATAEADFFVSTTLGYVSQHVLPVLDWEPSGAYAGDVDWVLTWLRRVESAYGVKPWVYMNAWTANHYDWSRVAAEDYGLWLAGYPTGGGDMSNPPDSMPYATGAWSFAAAWQWSSSAYAGAYVGDVNVFYGDEASWDAYAGGSPRQPDGSATTVPAKPETPSTTPANGSQGQSCGAVCVVVRSGDTLSGIAAANGGAWTEWTGYASGDPNRIYPGETVCRGNTTATTGGGSYTVRSGDTLSGIAVRFGVNMNTIRGYRSGNPNLIYPGEVLYW